MRLRFWVGSSPIDAPRDHSLASAPHMPHTLRLLPALLGLTAATAMADVAVKKLDDRVRVEIDGKLFTELRYTGFDHVCYWPLIGPGGVKLTRSWPLEDVPGEEHDHPHHKSMWFAHGLLNGDDYWSELATYGGKPPKIPIGKIVHDQIIKAEGGAKSGEVVTSQKWIASDGKTQTATSTQRLVVYATPDSERKFDFEVTLTAGDKDVVIGETKEGTMALRIAETMRTKAAKGSKTPAQGHILNSTGAKDEEVWGKEANWVAMNGPIDGKPFTISMFDHPSNLRHPTRWHARDYGLFAANPFGGSLMEKTLPKGAGDHPLPAGKTLTFKYRIVVQQGEPAAAKINALYDSYTKEIK